MSSVSETHLPFVRSGHIEYLQALGHVPQLLHKGTGRWDAITLPCSNGLSADLL